MTANKRYYSDSERSTDRSTVTVNVHDKTVYDFQSVY